MLKVDLGRDLAEAMSRPEGPQKATTNAILLLINALHLVEPMPGQRQLIRPLCDGTMPEGALLGTLNQLSIHTRTIRSVGHGDIIKTATQHPKAPSQARTTLKALAMLLQSERCALCEQKPVDRDALVMLYLKQTTGLQTYGNLGKERSNWRRRFMGAGIFGEPRQMRAFVCAVLLAMLGREAKIMITKATDRGTIASLRTVSARVQARMRDQVPDALVAGVLGSMFDFSMHSDRQVSTTLENLAGASLAPLFKHNTGEISMITGDIIPPGLLSG
jgi:hypothetical protein